MHLYRWLIFTLKGATPDCFFCYTIGLKSQVCAVQVFTQIKPAVYDLWLIGTAYYWQNPGQIAFPPTPYRTHSSKTDSLFEKHLKLF